MELREVIGPLLFMTSIFMLNILSRTIFGPLMLRVEADLTISHAQAASFFLYTAAGFAISQFLSGFISSRLIHRTVIRATAMAVGLTLTLVAFSPSLWLIRAALFMLGLAAGPYLPSGMATLTALVRQRSWGMAIGIHQLAPNMSFFLGPVLVELLGRFLSWREILLILAALSLGLGSSYGRIARGGRFYGQAPNLSALSSLLTRKAMWIVTVVFSLGVACGMGVYSMLPVYLVVERGLTETEANTLLALARGLAVVVGLIGGWLMDRIGLRRTLVASAWIAGASTVALGLVPDSLLWPVVLFQPLFPVCLSLASFGAVARITDASSRNVAVSLAVVTAMFGGGGLFPALLGWIAERAPMAYGFSALGCLMILAGLLPFVLDLSRPDQNNTGDRS